MSLLPRATVLGSVGLTALLAIATPVAAGSTLVEQRILTQEGLAIALASTVLQSQLEILLNAFATNTNCSVLAGNAGSVKLISSDRVSSTEVKAVVEVYFDTACTKPYITANATIDSVADSVNVTETAAYTDVKNEDLGSLAIDESAFANADGTITGVSGLGQFTPQNGAVTVDLGLECVLPKNAKTAFPCSGGIAQDFPKLHEALASVTPLTLTPTKTKTGYSVVFAGTKSDMVKGALGDLSITAPTHSSLGIGGQPVRYGTAVTAGSAAAFSLFPPTPTSWTITDTKNDAKFSIAVVSDKTRDSKGTVSTISTGAVLATFAVDQSGTGSITYSDTSKEPITSWLLAD